MKRSKGVLAVVVVFLLAFTALAGCATKTTEETTSPSVSPSMETAVSESPEESKATEVTEEHTTKPLKFGYIYVSAHYFFDPATKGGEDMAAQLKEQYGANIEVVANSASDASVTGQIQIMEDMISQGYDAIAIGVIDPAALTPVINEATDAGIIVVTMDTDAPDSNRLCYIGTDHYNWGTLAADYVADNIIKDSGKGVLIEHGSASMLNLVTRLKAFQDVFKAKGVSIIDTQVPADSSSETSMSLIETMTNAHPDFGCMMIDNAGGEVIVNIWKAHGWTAKDHPAVLSDDLTPIIDAIKDGTITATVAQGQYNWGTTACQVMYDAINGKMPESTTIDTGCTVVDSSNVYELYPDTTE